MPKKLMNMISDESDTERSIGCMKGVSQMFEKHPRHSLQQRFFSRRTNFSNNAKNEYLHVSCDDIHQLHMGRQKGSPSVKKLYRTASFDSSNRKRSFLVGQGSPLHLQPHSFDFEDRTQPSLAASPLHFNSSPNIYPQKGQKAMASSKVTSLEFDDEIIDRVFGAESRESIGHKRRQSNFSGLRGDTLEGGFAPLEDQVSGIYDDRKNSSSHTFDSKGFQKHIEESNDLVSSWLDCRERAIDDLKESLRLLNKMKDPEHHSDFRKESQFTQKDVVRYTIEECLQEIAHANFKLPMNTGEKSKESSPFKQARRSEENGHSVDHKDHLGRNSQKGKEPPKVLLEGRKPVKPNIVLPENFKQTRIYSKESLGVVPQKINDFKGKYGPRSQGQSNLVDFSEISVINREKNKRMPNVIARLMGLDAMPDAKHSVRRESEKRPPYQQGILYNMTNQKEIPTKKKLMDKICQEHRNVQILSAEVDDEFSDDEMIEDSMGIQSAEDGKMKRKAVSKHRSTENISILDEQRRTEDASNETCKQQEFFSFESPFRVPNDRGEVTFQKTFLERRRSESHLEILKRLNSINPVSCTSHGLDEDVEARIRQLRLQTALEEHKNLRGILETMQLKGLLHSPLPKHMQGFQQPKSIDEVPRMKHEDETTEVKIKDFQSLELPADKQDFPPNMAYKRHQTGSTESGPGTLHDKRNFKEAAIVLIKPILGSEGNSFTVPSHDPLESQNSKSYSIVMPLESVTEQTPILESKKTGRKKITGLNSGANVTPSRIQNLTHAFESRDGVQTAEHKVPYKQQFQDLQVQDFEQLEREEGLSPAPPIFKLLASMSKEQLLGKDSTIGEEDFTDLVRDNRSPENTNRGALQNSKPLGKPYHKSQGKKASAGFKEGFLHKTSMHHDGVTPYNIRLPIIPPEITNLNSHDENSRLNFQVTTMPRKSEKNTGFHMLNDGGTPLYCMEDITKGSPLTGLDSEETEFSSIKEFSSETTMQNFKDAVSAEETALNDPDCPLHRTKHTKSLQDLHGEREGKPYRDPREPSNGPKMDALSLFLSDFADISNKLEDLNIDGEDNYVRCMNGQDDDVRAKLTEAKLYAKLEIPKREQLKRQLFKTLETVKEFPDEMKSRGELHLNGSIANVSNSLGQECSLQLYTHRSQVHDQITTSEMKNEIWRDSKTMRAELEAELKLDRERPLERHLSEAHSSDQKLHILDVQEEDPVEELLMRHAATYQAAETFSTDSERPSPLSVLDIHFQEDEQVHTTKSLFPSKPKESAPQSPLMHSSRRRSLEFNLQRHADKILQEVEILQDMSGVVYATFQTDLRRYHKGNDRKNGQLQDNLSVPDSGKFKWQSDGMASIKDILQIPGFREMSAQKTNPATKESEQYQKHDAVAEIDEMGMKTLEIAECRVHVECVTEIIAKKLLPYVDPHPWVSSCGFICQKRPSGDQLVQQAWKELQELPCLPLQDACDMLHILLEQDLAPTPSGWSDLKAETVEVGFHVADLIFVDVVQDTISDLLCSL